jgi:hypothetical protein
MSKSLGVFEDRHVHLSFKRRAEAGHDRISKVPEDHARIAISAQLCVTRMPRPEIFLKASRSALTATSAAGTNWFDLTREFIGSTEKLQDRKWAVRENRRILTLPSTGKSGWQSGGLWPGVSGPGSWKGAVPEAGAPAPVSRCAPTLAAPHFFLRKVNRRILIGPPSLKWPLSLRGTSGEGLGRGARSIELSRSFENPSP